MRNALLAALLAPFLLACGDDTVNYSAPVGINVKLRSADVTVGAVLLTKSINKEQGNPYGAFVNAAQRALGRPPSRIVVTYLSLELLGTSTVTGLNEVFTGQVSIGFDLDGPEPSRSTAFESPASARSRGASTRARAERSRRCSIKRSPAAGCPPPRAYRVFARDGWR